MILCFLGEAGLGLMRSYNCCFRCSWHTIHSRKVERRLIYRILFEKVKQGGPFIHVTPVLGLVVF